MDKGKFKLIARYSSDDKHFLIQDSLGKRLKITDNQLYLLIGAGKIINYYLTFFNGHPLLKSISGSDTLEVIDNSNTSYKIVEEIVDVNKTVGYNLTNGNERLSNVPITNVIEYAKHGQIDGVTYNLTDKILEFTNPDDLYNIQIINKNTNKRIFRSILKMEYTNDDTGFKPEITMSPLGKMEQIAYNDDVTRLCSEIGVDVETFTYGLIKMYYMTDKIIRIGNETNIFDIIIENAKHLEITRIGIMNTVAKAIKHFDFNCKQLKITTCDREGQELAQYNYTF